MDLRALKLHLYLVESTGPNPKTSLHASEQALQE